MYCESPARAGGSTLMATSRPRRGSRARYTWPIPPSPSFPRIWYGPIDEGSGIVSEYDITPARCRPLLPVALEVQVDLRLSLDRLAVQHRRTIDPALHCVGRGLPQQRVAF